MIAGRERDIGPRAPLVVVDDSNVIAAVTDEIIGAGWSVQPPAAASGPSVVVSMPVENRADAQAAVLIALRGNGLLIRSATDREVIDDLVDDLSRIGRVLLTDPATVVRLDPDTWRLLHALADGHTVSVAAAALHLSMRTANRRLTEARTALRTGSRAQLLRAVTSPERIPRVSR